MAKESEGLSSKIYDPESITSQNILGKRYSDFEQDRDVIGGDINSPIVSRYMNGEKFDINSNDKLYQIVKDVRNLVDNMFYNQGITTVSFGFGINVNLHAVVFTLSFNNNQVEENIASFIDGFIGAVKSLINQKYSDSAEVSHDVRDLMGSQTAELTTGKTQVTITIKEKTKEE